MKNFVINEILFTEVPARNEYVRVQVTEFDRNKRPHSYCIYIPRERWEQAVKGDNYNQKVIKGAYELLRDNGYYSLITNN